MSDYIMREAVASDIPSMCAFIFEHGPNEWNHLPPEEVRPHLEKIANGEVRAVLAEQGGVLAGFVSFHQTTEYSRYQSDDGKERIHGYVDEAVVHRGHTGKGLGPRMLKVVNERLFEQGISEIYIMRHEENRPSAAMMEKAGYVVIDTFDDPKRRPTGSRRTVICRIAHAL